MIQGSENIPNYLVFWGFFTLESSKTQNNHTTAINVVIVPPTFQISNLFIIRNVIDFINSHLQYGSPASVIKRMEKVSFGQNHHFYF